MGSFVSCCLGSEGRRDSKGYRRRGVGGTTKRKEAQRTTTAQNRYAQESFKTKCNCDLEEQRRQVENRRDVQISYALRRRQQRMEEMERREKELARMGGPLFLRWKVSF